MSAQESCGCERSREIKRDQERDQERSREIKREERQTLKEMSNDFILMKGNGLYLKAALLLKGVKHCVLLPLLETIVDGKMKAAV